MEADPYELSSAFQAALGILVTNIRLAERYIDGSLDVRKLARGLTQPDVSALRAIATLDGARLLVLSDLLTSRRKASLGRLVPVTCRLLGALFHDYWLRFLETEADAGVRLPYVEAAEFTGWLLGRLEHSCMDRQFIRVERCRNEVASRMSARASLSPRPVVNSSDECRVRLSEQVILERFDSRIEEAMTAFRQSGDRLVPQGGTQDLFLLFHPKKHGTRSVGVKRLSEATGIALDGARGGAVFCDLLWNVPENRRGAVRETLRHLLEIGALQVVP